MTGSATPPFPNTQSPHRSIGHQSIRDGRTLHRDGQDPRNLQISGVSTRRNSQYVYYRLYTKDGPIKSQHPVYSTDHEPFIGHTLAKRVAPPHTTASIKRHLCYIEGFSSSLADTAKLFVPLSCLTAKDDSARLSLVGSSGPGLSPQEPMALVLRGQERSQGAVHQLPLAERDISDFGKNRYIYYRPYSLEGAMKSKTCFDESDIYLGRIDTFSVPPPHNITSLTACIARIEGLVVQDAEEIRIFKDAASDVPMRMDATLSLTEDAYLGNDEDDPVAVVHTPHRLQNSDITLVPGHCDPSWFSIMPTDTLRPDKNNGKKFYLLPIHETVRLEAQFKVDGVLIFQSAGLNMDSCVSRDIEGVWINILDASNNSILHMSIRRGQGTIAFNHLMASNNRWGGEQRVPLKGLFKAPNPTIIIYDNGDRFQVMVDYRTVAYFEKRIKEDGVAVVYDKDPDQVSPFSTTLAMTAYTSFADVITRVTS